MSDHLVRMLIAEFLAERDLYSEVGLSRLPENLAVLLDCPVDEAMERARDLLDQLEVIDLKPLFAIRDMAIVSKTAAALATELREASYAECCRAALAYALLEKQGHVFTALRAASAKHDDWARHHYLYGLVLALHGDSTRAIWELELALRHEPYEDGRIHIREAIDQLEEAA